MSAVVTKDNPMQPVTQQSAVLAVIERAAANPEVDIDKMERLFAMHRSLVNDDKLAAFNSALNQAQAEMGRIAADASNPQTRSLYASYGKIDRVIRPIYTRHGFALSFDEAESPKPDHIRVLCYVSHKAGHTATYHKDMPADGKGAKGGDVMTKTHAAAAAQSYGRRYLVLGIFNLAIGEEDRDGNAAPAEEAKAPDDYDRWQADVRAIADEGTARLQDLWKRSPNDIRMFTVKFRMTWWEEMKAIAAKVRLEVA